MNKPTVLFFFLLSFYSSFSQVQDPLIDIIKEELDRELKYLSQEEYKPYYLAYTVDDYDFYQLSISKGSIISETEDDGRSLSCQLKVGSYELDNTHDISGYGTGYQASAGTMPIPLANDRQAIHKCMWTITDNAYKRARDDYKTVLNSDLGEKKAVDDFSKGETNRYVAPFIKDPLQFERDEWKTFLKTVTTSLTEVENLIAGGAYLNVANERKYLVSNDGSEIVQNFPRFELYINASVLAEDNTEVPLYLSYYGVDESDLPAKDEIAKDIETLKKKLELLKTAPKADPFTGPAIFSADVSGVFFHEIFGHRMEGHRLKNESDGQTFKDKLGEYVLPKYLSVISDPTMEKFEDIRLTGFYKFDDEGVKARKVALVENGKLSNFLMSRTPMEHFQRSNGHGRSQSGLTPVSRQSNLIIRTTQTNSDEDLKKKLIKLLKKQKKPYGYYFKEVTGGFTNTDRYSPNSFNITPTEVYRIYTDGREELIRGVDVIGTPLAMFSEITATGSEYKTFFGYCGAESGSIPVTATAPAILVNKIETQKKPSYEINLPILPAPESNK
ncbi:MAG: metallopeptidase TldD-related protein [Cyclobacteriaceae bacterium]